MFKFNDRLSTLLNLDFIISANYEKTDIYIVLKDEENLELSYDEPLTANQDYQRFLETCLNLKTI